MTRQDRADSTSPEQPACRALARHNRSGQSDEPSAAQLTHARTSRTFLFTSGTPRPRDRPKIQGPNVTASRADGHAGRGIGTGVVTGFRSPSLVALQAEVGREKFQPEVIHRVWTQTCGQPWLVNALCDRACFQNKQERDRPITEDDVLEAQEQLILERTVHLDQLADRLRENRVRRVIEPLLSDDDRIAVESSAFVRQRDLEYARDLGLLARDDPPRIANPIYREVVPSEASPQTNELGSVSRYCHRTAATVRAHLGHGPSCLPSSALSAAKLDSNVTHSGRQGP